MRLDLGGCFCQGETVCFLQKRSQCGVHGGMILIQPLTLLGRKQCGVDGGTLKGYLGLGIKALEAAVLIFEALFAYQKVFQTDTIAALQIQARLVGKNHAAFQYGILPC